MSIYQVQNSSKRITGMATGLDTDEVIKGMLQREQAKINAAEGGRVYNTWRQESYRDVISKIKAFSDKYLDVLSSDYILSDSKLSNFSVAYGTTNNNFSIEAGASAIPGTYTMRVNQMAQKASRVSSSNLSYATANGKVALTKKIDTQNDEFTINGNAVTLSTKNYSNVSQIAAEFNTQFDDNSLAVKASVNDSGKIQFDNKITITNSNNDIRVTLNGKDYDVELASGDFTLEEINMSLNSKLASATAGDGTVFSSEGYNLELTSDRLGIVMKKDGESDISNAVTVVSSGINLEATSTTVDSTEKNGSLATVSNFTINSNEIEFENRIIAGVNDTLVINNDGTKTTITLDPKVYTGTEDVQTTTIVNDINTKLSNAGIGYLTLSKNSDNKIVFKSTEDDPVTISGNASSNIGIYDNYKVKTRVDNTASDILSGVQEFEINGKTFKFDFDSDTDAGDTIGASKMSLRDVFKKIRDETDVEIRYSELTRKFLIETKDTGVAKSLDVSDTSGNFISTLFGGDIAGVTGQDAQMVLTDPSGLSNTVNKDSNKFTVDGISYDLKKTMTGDETFTVSSNVDDAVKNIKEFISDYNGLIADLNGKVDEKKNYKYEPLTVEQKKELNEDEIKDWNSKAKKGLMSNDYVISNMLSKMRNSFFDGIDGNTTALKDIGITSSADYTKKGKIEVDEAKLKLALINNIDDVKEMLIGNSDTIPTYSRSAKAAERSTRYKESGIFTRMNDIIQDNVSTYRDSNSKKGSLIEIAGIEGDGSFTKNQITTRITEKEDLVKELTRKMYDKQERLYKQFARLEQMMNQYNSQASYFASQMGGGQ